MKITTFLKFLVIFAAVDYWIYVDAKTDYSFLTDEIVDEYANVLEKFVPTNVKEENETIYAIPVANVAFPSNEFIQFLKEKEGFFNKRYKCPADVTTIGYGFTKDGVEDAIRMGFLPDDYKLPMTMTRKQADDFLVDVMIPTYDKMVQENVHVPLTNNQREALVSFTYNLGEKNLQNLAEQLNKNDYNISKRILKYCYAKKKRLTGLAVRREQEVRLWKNI